MCLFSGAIFDIGNDEAQLSFKHAIFRENMYGAKFNLVPVIKVLDTTNTYDVEQAGELCDIFYRKPFIFNLYFF